MNTTNLDHSASYTFKLEVYADSQQAVLACLTHLLTQFQQEGVPVGTDTLTGPGFEAFTQTVVLD
ncbi:hypothetical protein BH09BAC4_BH09BAC4_32720 [soil metagenome]